MDEKLEEALRKTIKFRCGFDKSLAGTFFILGSDDEKLAEITESLIEEARGLYKDDRGFFFTPDENLNSMMDFIEDRLCPLLFRSAVMGSKVLLAFFESVDKVFRFNSVVLKEEYDERILDQVFVRIDDTIMDLDPSDQEYLFSFIFDTHMPEKLTTFWAEDIFYWCLQAFPIQRFGDRLISLIEEYADPSSQIFPEMMRLELAFSFVVDRERYDRLCKQYSYIPEVREDTLKNMSVLEPEKAAQLIAKEYSDALLNNDSYDRKLYGDLLLQIYGRLESPDYLPFLKRLVQDEEGSNLQHIVLLRQEMPEAEWPTWREKILGLSKIDRLEFLNSEEEYDRLVEELKAKDASLQEWLKYSDALMKSSFCGRSADILASVILKSNGQKDFDFDDAFELIEVIAGIDDDGRKKALELIEILLGPDWNLRQKSIDDLRCLKAELSEK